MVFHGRVWDCIGGGGRVGRLTHCGDVDCLQGGLASIRVDEEEIERVEDEVEEAITSFSDEPLWFEVTNIDYVTEIFSILSWHVKVETEILLLPQFDQLKCWAIHFVSSR